VDQAQSGRILVKCNVVRLNVVPISSGCSKSLNFGFYFRGDLDGISSVLPWRAVS